VGRPLSTVFEVLVKNLTSEIRLKKNGVPEVEAAIDVIMPSMLLHWRQRSEQVIRELERRHDDAFNRDTLIATLASIMLRLEVLRPADLRSLDDLTDLLFHEGQQAAGLQGLALAPALGRLDARAAAVDDLNLALQGKVREARAEIARFLRSELPTLATPAEARVALRAALSAALGADGAWIAAAVSNWAYRWYGAAVAAGADAQGLTRLRAVNNPPIGPDARTTPFCIYAHGREIVGGTRTVMAAFEQYVNAVRLGDWLGVQAVMPFRTTAPPAGTPLLAPPPYHQNCRTVPEVIR
jgi:hypothetical protein